MTQPMFAITIDTREQTPWLFEGMTKTIKGEVRQIEVPTLTTGLKTGDYSIVGHEERICIERKSKSDLIGTVTRGRERFQRELDRMQSMDFSAVIVEADWRDVIETCVRETEMNPVSLDSSMLTFMMRYPRTHWIFRPTRFLAMKTAYKVFDLYYRRILKETTDGK